MKKLLLIALIVSLINVFVVSAVECNADLTNWNNSECFVTQNLTLSGGNLVMNGSIIIDEPVVFDGNGAVLSNWANGGFFLDSTSNGVLTLKNFEMLGYNNAPYSNINYCIYHRLGDNTDLVVEGVDVTCLREGFVRPTSVGFHNGNNFLKDSNFTGISQSSAYQGIDTSYIYNVVVDNVGSFASTNACVTRGISGNDLTCSAVAGTYYALETSYGVNITGFDSAGDNVNIGNGREAVIFKDSTIRDLTLGWYVPLATERYGLIQNTSVRYAYLMGGEELIEFDDSTVSRLRFAGSNPSNVIYDFKNGDVTDLEMTNFIANRNLTFVSDESSTSIKFVLENTGLELNLGAILNFGDNYAWVQSGSLLDQPATITFDNLASDSSEYIVYKDGSEAVLGVDFNVSFSDVDTLSIDVGGFSNWSIEVWDGQCEPTLQRLPCELSSDLTLSGGDIYLPVLNWSVLNSDIDVTAPDLTIYGNGSTIYRNTTENTMFVKSVNGNGLTIRDLTIRNVGDYKEAVLFQFNYPLSDKGVNFYNVDFDCSNDYCINLNTNTFSDLLIQDSVLAGSNVCVQDFSGNTINVYDSEFYCLTPIRSSTFLSAFDIRDNFFSPYNSVQHGVGLDFDRVQYGSTLKNNTFFKNSTHYFSRDFLVLVETSIYVEDNFFGTSINFNNYNSNTGNSHFIGNTFDDTFNSGSTIKESYINHKLLMQDNIFLGDNYFRFDSDNSFPLSMRFGLDEQSKNLRYLFQRDYNWSSWEFFNSGAEVLFGENSFYDSAFDYLNFSTYRVLEDDIMIRDNWAFMRTGFVFDEPASITFFGVNDPLMIAYKDGAECGASCLNFVNDGENISFDVLVGGNYSYYYVPNIPPEIVEVVPSENPELPFGREQTFDVSVYDADNGTISYLWYLDGNLTTETSNVFTYTSARENVGIHELEVIVTDGEDEVSYLWFVEDLAKYNNQYVAEDVAKVGIDWLTNLLIFFGGLVGVAGVYLVFAYFTGRKPFNKFGGTLK